MKNRRKRQKWDAHLRLDEALTVAVVSQLSMFHFTFESLFYVLRLSFTLVGLIMPDSKG